MEHPITRRQVLGAASAALATACARESMVSAETQGARMVSPKKRMPVVFVGHGSPMNAVEDNAWSRGFAALGAALPLPKAILAVSAHWYGSGTWVTGNAQPKTIHDFGGFPKALHDMQYPAAGSPRLAQRVVDLLGPTRAQVSQAWGLDHGTWCVLAAMFPKANIPVVQLSINAQWDGETHLITGRALAPLRDEGVLILGSGNITHNLGHAMSVLQGGNPQTLGWALDFDAGVAGALEQRDHRWLARAPSLPQGKMSHPSPDHYWPLLYVAGAMSPSDAVTWPILGFDAGSLSMRAVLAQGTA